MAKKGERVLLIWKIKNYRSIYVPKAMYPKLLATILVIFVVLLMIINYSLHNLLTSLILTVIFFSLFIIWFLIIYLVDNMFVTRNRSKNVKYFITNKAIYVMSDKSKSYSFLRAIQMLRLSLVSRYYVKDGFVYVITRSWLLPLDISKFRIEPNNNINQIISVLNKLKIPRAKS
ncbi:MAG TPA: hypothetical protein P5277_01580 [Candidatus Paceibacterota bacterium]|nr:hypothetical protein [Candidatus Paceibacterota bacterium]